jgi:hypothetical protein
MGVGSTILSSELSWTDSSDSNSGIIATTLRFSKNFASVGGLIESSPVGEAVRTNILNVPHYRTHPFAEYRLQRKLGK